MIAYNLIVPVHNRPLEVRSLLQSILEMETAGLLYAVLVVDDHSTKDCQSICEEYKERLPLRYFYLPKRVGAGKARNYAMERAEGDYYIVLDSDTTLPPDYLLRINDALNEHYTDTFTAPDTAHNCFTAFQKAVNVAMTHPLTTGGIRGKKRRLTKVQLRSFNMGLSQGAFRMTGGFTDRKIGEDIELSIKAQRCGLSCQMIASAKVFHQRKRGGRSFFKQCYAFGKGRAELMEQYKEARGAVYGLPSFFVGAVALGILLSSKGVYELLMVIGTYLIVIASNAGYQWQSAKVGIMSIYTTLLQMCGYGLGFVEGRAKSFLKYTKRRMFQRISKNP